MITSDKDNKGKEGVSWIYDTPSFFSSDFTDESEAVLLIGLLTEFRGYLAAGQWDHARYVLLLFFVTQISQMTQIFLRGIILSHRFHRYTQIFFIGFHG